MTGEVTVPGMRVDNQSDGANNHPSTVYQTPNGDLWVAVLYLGNLNLQRSKDLGATWLAAPIVVDATISSDGGVVAMADVVQGGVTQLLVFVSENKSGRQLVYRINQDATDLSASKWTNESAALPAWVGAERSDDHLAVRSYDNRVYVGFKTEGAAASDEPLMGLLVRQPGGTWTRYTSFFTDDGRRETRPGVVIDESNNEVYLFYDMINAPNAGAYKRVTNLVARVARDGNRNPGLHTRNPFQCPDEPPQRHVCQQPCRDLGVAHHHRHRQCRPQGPVTTAGGVGRQRGSHTHHRGGQLDDRCDR